MADGARTVKVRFTGDATDVSRAAETAEQKMERLKGKVGDLAHTASLASAAVLVGIGAFVAQGAQSLIEIERLNAQTTQAIKSTQAAWTDTKHLTDYAEQIEKTTGIERESVQEGQNLLLTFTNIQNQVGEGNDVFDQATSILVDMATAMGTDVKSSAIQLGKALNDPIKGITALTKVGVTFTEQQRKQIEAMVEVGDIAGAQKVILAELNREFGGSAAAFGETTAGQLAKLKNEFGDVQEQLATSFAPALTEVFDLLKGVTGWAAENPNAFKNLVLGIGGLATTVLTVNAAVTTYKTVVDAAKLATELWTAASVALDAALAGGWVAALGPLALAIGAIVLGIGLITKGMEGLGVTWGDVWDYIVDKTFFLWEYSKNFWAFMLSIPAALLTAFSVVAGGIANPFISAFNWIARQWNNTIGKLSADIPGIGHIDVPDIAYAQYRQYGGPVRAGMPYVVGEGAGPELFVPSAPGTIVPNPGDGGSWGGDTYVAVQIGNESIAAVARAERIRSSKGTRRWVLAAQGGRA